MTISILKLSAGQTIARPYNRASGVAEMQEMIGFAIAYANGIKRPSNDQAEQFGMDVHSENLDSEMPVHVMADGSKFYAFRESNS